MDTHFGIKFHQNYSPNMGVHVRYADPPHQKGDVSYKSSVSGT
jgi:hypothetical protein